MIRSIWNGTKHTLYCLYKAGDDTINHDGIEHAGYLSFLSMLAIFPFLVFLVSLAGTMENTHLGTNFVNFMVEHLPDELISALKPRIEEIISGPPQGLISLAILGAIWTASSAVEGLRTILNRAYRVPTPPAYIWRRLLSIGQFLIFTCVIIIAMLVLVFSPLVIEQLNKITSFVDFLKPVWLYANFVITHLLLFIGISSLYYFLPNMRIRWRQVVPGAVLVVILWSVGASLLSFYLNEFKQVSLIYGSLGGIIISLLFFYITNMIFIYGAEFNYQLNHDDPEVI